MAVTYRKLRTGGWGVLITEEDASGIEVGDRLAVLVKRRDGVEDERFVAAIWKGKNLDGEGDAVLAVFAKADETAPTERRKAPSQNDERRTVEERMRSELLLDHKTLAEYVKEGEPACGMYDYTMTAGGKKH